MQTDRKKVIDDTADWFPKLIYQDAQEELYNSLSGQLNTLVDTERGVKSASSSVFSRSDLEAHRPDKDHFLLHVIAMGGYPTYMPNRNGDAFPSKTLEDYHDTFVKNGHFFREHNHSDPSLKIGDVKASAYDKDTDRVELLIWGHKKKASDEYEMARDGKELSFSMSCKTKYDICSCCDNVARNPRYYCDHLKKQMGQYVPEFNKYAFALTPVARFFDISKVKRPADRIAHHIAYMFPESDDVGGMVKAASAGELIIPGYLAAKAEGALPEYVYTPYSSSLEKLREAEEWFADRIKSAHLLSDPETLFYFQVIPDAMRNEKLDGEPVEMSKVANVRPGTLFNRLAKKDSILPAQEFSTYVGMDEDIDTNGLFGRMTKEASVLDILSELPALFGSAGETNCMLDPENNDVVDDVMAKMADKFSCAVEPMQHKAVTIIIKMGSAISGNKTYNVTENPLNTAEKAYASYQLAAYEDMVAKGSDPEMLAKTIVACNYYRRCG
jgi:hypothetical protein